MAGTTIGVRVLRRYVQFCLVGGSGLAVDMAILWLLADTAMLGWNLNLSKVVAAEVAIVNNFAWNDLWTFRGLGVERSLWWSRLLRFAKFNLICLAGIALSVALLNAQVRWLGMNVYLANFISIVTVSVWNFLMNLKFGWKEAAPRVQLRLQERLERPRGS
jgi:dolichol-phosphate mannosyltransferase